MQSVPFDGIVPHIIELREQVDNICHYKQAYDILLHTEVCEEGCQDVVVSKVRDYDDLEYIDASQIEGEPWSRYIDGKIILEDGINLTDGISTAPGYNVTAERLAYKLLLHLTIYGFSPEEIRKSFDNLWHDEYHDNEYGRKAREMENKIYMKWANKTIREHIRQSINKFLSEGKCGFALPQEDWRYIKNRNEHCNRMKRMRNHRLKMRLEALTNLDKYENTTQRLLSGQYQTMVSRDELSFLRNKNERFGTEFQTRSYDVAQRLAYLDELISKYGALRIVDNLEHAVIKVSTSSQYLLTDEERQYMLTSLSQKFDACKLLFIYAIQESLDTEIGIMIVGTKYSSMK